MKIFLKFLADFADLVGKDTVTIEIPDGSNVKHALQLIIQKYNTELGEVMMDLETNNLRPYVPLLFLLNGKNIQILNGLKTELKDGDLLTFFPPAMGGYKNPTM
jgi:molybdopterin synthase sulfur carrier subunit